MDNYCNNCGKPGHQYHQCKMPIISIGIIAFRRSSDGLQLLMIRRKNTLGYMDFMRGKYSIYNKEYIFNLLKEMTIEEKENIKKYGFDQLWRELWDESNISEQYKNEQQISCEKFNALKSGIMIQNDYYNICDLVDESNAYTTWDEAEWGFPKGRRNHHEKDIDCAFREFTEETGYPIRLLKPIENLIPYEEIFTGSNYKSYKHKYYLMKMTNSIDTNTPNQYDKSEVSKMEWKTYEECLKCIRPYNLEKKRILENIYSCLMNYAITEL